MTWQAYTAWVPQGVLVGAFTTMALSSAGAPMAVSLPFGLGYGGFITTIGLVSWRVGERDE